MDAFQEEIDALARVSLKETQVKDYFDRVFPTKAKPKPAAPEATTGTILDDVIAATEYQRENRRYVENVIEEQSDRERERLQRIYEQVLENFNNPGNTLPGVAGTAWAAFNAVTEYADHQRGTRGRDEADRADNRLYSNWFGSSNDIKQVAYEQALVMAK